MENEEEYGVYSGPCQGCGEPRMIDDMQICEECAMDIEADGF